MKKLALSILLSVSIISQGHTVVSIFTGGAPVAIAGLAVALGGSGAFTLGLGYAFGCAFDEESTSKSCRAKDTAFLTSMIAVPVGLILLNDKGQRAHFSEISEEAAQQLGVNVQEMQTYNNEIEMINAINEDASNVKTAQESAVIWSEGLQNLSSETSAVLNKIVSHK